jgi:hypothetical protein
LVQEARTTVSLSNSLILFSFILHT